MDSAQQKKIRDKVNYYVTNSGLVISNLDSNWLEFNYLPSGCDESSCTSVESKLVGIEVKLMIPIDIAVFNLPEFRHVVLRESLSNTIKNNNDTIETNTVCN